MLFSIIIFIITLLFLVIIHELGHFLMAKKFHIKVLEFGFGIPPKVFGKKFGETIYSLNWLPIGGFVKLLGEDEVGPLAISRKGPETSRDFRAKSVEQRIAVVIAGIVMNLILAWIIFYIVLFGQNFKIIYPTSEPTITVADVQKDLPAAKAGIKPGERLLSIDGKKVDRIEDARNIIKSKENQTLDLSLSDIDGKNVRMVQVIPKKVEGKDVLIGVIFSPIPFKSYVTPAEKAFSGINYSMHITKLTFVGLGQLINQLLTGDFTKVSQQVVGPVGLASASHDILSGGWQAILPYLWFTGLISQTLAIFNFLPIPALDGGRLLFLYIEAIIGKRVHSKLESQIHAVGMAILLTLMMLVTFSDIRKLIF